ncbi:hypothetical protein ACIRL2_29190 [Embleya sp. NPDC127516]|uniref:hypothetical protein n=1 Tax=Embleya sp. NPDC127516 TaxID=3363990 RepID=UPI0037F91B05
MQPSSADRDLTAIRDLWPELVAAPGTRPRDSGTPRPLTAAEQAAQEERYAAEREDREKGAIGRGASPAPLDLDLLHVERTLAEDLCDLADRVASRVQRPPASVSARVESSRVWLTRGVRPVRIARPVLGPIPAEDPGRWRYNASHRHGAEWACTWLLGALDDGVPTLVLDDITTTARRILRQLRTALDHQTERYVGACPNPACGVDLAVAPDDDVVTCTGCRTAYGRRAWTRIARARGAA